MIFIFLTIFSYFAAFLVIFALGRRKNAYADKIALAASAISLAAFFVMLFVPSLQGEFIFASYRISAIEFDFGFLTDKLALLMGGIVSFVTTLVLLYSRDYMRQDPEKGRFFALLCFFAGSMLGIVYSVSFVQLFIFWELVGLSSYFLIGFWWKDPAVSSSARKVFTTIVVGDVLLLLGFLILGSAFGTFTFSEILQEHLHVALPATGVFLVLLGAFTKSAQLPFTMWLPWAMEGPTPVSALLHSATMVKAGVFLIARILPLVFAAHLTGFVVVFALLTVFVASLAALVEEDIKRILAYSTISQLGFIALGLGLGAYGASLFHLFNDAFYKALLFLGAGVIIHAGGSRNIFELKQLHWAREKTFLLLTIIGVLGLSGLPPFNGFFSKDLIIDAAKESGNLGLFVLTLVAAFLSALYISRWIFLILRNVSKKEEGVGPERGNFSWSTKIPMGMLALGVLMTGWFSKQFFSWVGGGEPSYHLPLSLLSILLVSAAFCISYLAYFEKVISPDRLALLCSGVYRLFRAKFGLPWFYGILGRFFYALGQALGEFDRYVIDSALHGVAFVGRGVSAFCFMLDRKLLNGALELTVRAVTKLCFGSYAFDMSYVDRIVRSFYDILAASSGFSRRIISGSIASYVAALLIAVIFSVLFLNGVLAK
ncbi:MAG: NADH-quinone oxidoreductase subunit L [bacterium]|nr:NADH-quinone oxidoreductase subunit L [bacterium]